MKRHVFAILAVIGLTVGCDSRTDREKLQGEWVLRTMSGDFTFGLGATKAGHETLIFTNDEFSFAHRGDHSGVTGSFSCDETKKPKQITFNFHGRSLVGIYDFSWGRLVICVGEDDKAPSKFFTGPARTSRPATLVFEPLKKK